MADHYVVGVLALQGAFAKHIEMLQKLGIATKEVRRPEDLNDCDALIIPGGESSVILRQIRFIEFENALKKFSTQNPIFGTCAGCILMSKDVIGGSVQPFNLIDVQVERNAFGRQAESFQTDIELNLAGEHSRRIPAIFIRAPRIRSYGPDIKVLARYEDEPVLVQQGIHLASTFHPELTGNTTIHRYFLTLIRQKHK